MKRIRHNFGGSTVETLLVIYGISVMIMGAYYNWKYAVENGFIQWLFLGEIVASLKALIWPFFVFFT